MSLIIYYDKSMVPSGMKLITNNDYYFDSNIHLENTPEVRRLLLNIDDASYQAPDIIVSNKHKSRGDIYSIYLSTGCKSALNVLLSNEHVVIDSHQMGDNAYNEALLLNKGFMLYKVVLTGLPLETSCDIIFEGIHCKTIDEYNKAVWRYIHEH